MRIEKFLLIKCPYPTHDFYHIGEQGDMFAGFKVYFSGLEEKDIKVIVGLKGSRENDLTYMVIKGDIDITSDIGEKLISGYFVEKLSKSSPFSTWTPFIAMNEEYQTRLYGDDLIEKDLNIDLPYLREDITIRNPEITLRILERLKSEVGYETVSNAIDSLDEEIGSKRDLIESPNSDFVTNWQLDYLLSLITKSILLGTGIPSLSENDLPTP